MVVLDKIIHLSHEFNGKHPFIVIANPIKDFTWILPIPQSVQCIFNAILEFRVRSEHLIEIPPDDLTHLFRREGRVVAPVLVVPSRRRLGHLTIRVNYHGHHRQTIGIIWRIRSCLTGLVFKPVPQDDIELVHPFRCVPIEHAFSIRLSQAPIVVFSVLPGLLEGVNPHHLVFFLRCILGLSKFSLVLLHVLHPCGGETVYQVLSGHSVEVPVIFIDVGRVSDILQSAVKIGNCRGITQLSVKKHPCHAKDELSYLLVPQRRERSPQINPNEFVSLLLASSGAFHVKAGRTLNGFGFLRFI